uniref:WRKY transcription factor protein 40 n=1 Tax=Zanthoxylum armatum TaxID=67938 RepID=A0A8F1T016_9ROSI|nr:WRKY transcription factor protein 40 [Zanthoxylum armatum]
MSKASSSSTREASISISEDKSEDNYNDREEVKEMDRRAHRLVLPEDGYEWKKYGQKFIKNIGKFRSYFRCQMANCIAKKRAEWSTSTDIRIVYDGVHTHYGSSTTRPGSSGSSSNAANQYNLLTQVFGDQSTQQKQGRSS